MLTQKMGREEKRERMGAHTGEKEAPGPLASFCMFFPPPETTLCKLG